MIQPHALRAMPSSSEHGRHVMIDGWTLRPDGSVDPIAAELLDDPEHLAGVLHTLVGLVGMQILKPADMTIVPLKPDLVRTAQDCGGTTGVVLLTTSHCSVHTWPLRGQVSFDLYSCKDFDPDVVLAYLRDALRLSGGTHRAVVRQHDSTHAYSFVCQSS